MMTRAPPTVRREMQLRAADPTIWLSVFYPLPTVSVAASDTTAHYEMSGVPRRLDSVVLSDTALPHEMSTIDSIIDTSTAV